MSDTIRLSVITAGIALAIGAAFPAAGQQAPPPPPPGASPPSPFRLERFAEDWSEMDDPVKQTKPWHHLKSIKLGDARLTIGGDMRLRAEVVDAPLFGATGAGADTYVMRRTMLHADLRLSPSLRLFGQLSHHQSYGRTIPFPLDNDGLELQQGFVELSHAAAGASFGIRLGRQEIIFSPRFVHPREATNVRSTFDGVRGWAVYGPWRLEGFATRPVQNREGSFDDRGNPAERFDGIRLTRTFGARASWRITGSWYRQHRDALRLASTSGSDDRTSWGVRVAGRSGAFDIDAEHYWQRGTFAGRRIAAFGGAGEAGYMLGGRSRVRVGVRWLYGSGDSDSADSTIETFAGPFPRPPCCVDALWLAPSNLRVVTPFVQLTPHRTLALEPKLDVPKRLEATDAIYAIPQIAYPGSTGKSGDALGLGVGLSASWSPTPELSFTLQHQEQTATGALAASGARNSHYTAISAAFRF